jgi:hypothetical protein
MFAFSESYQRRGEKRLDFRSWLVSVDRLWHSDASLHLKACEILRTIDVVALGLWLAALYRMERYIEIG